jgi:N-acetylglutamate synthase-like GNAT family acetyltransferase
MTASSFLEISKASIGDLPLVLALIRQCELLETGVAEAIDGFFVAHSAGMLVGCAGLEVHAEFGLLRSVAVGPSQRKAGLGTKLVEGVADAARAQGLRELLLLTTTAPTFFERRGFSAVLRSSVPAQIAESWEFRVGCPQTARVMHLALREA